MAISQCYVMFLLISAFRPSSVTENLRGGCYTISGYETFVEVFPKYTRAITN